MYRINKTSNSVHSLEEKTFSSLGFREREHLQEWIAKKPSVLGEELLIIQKEFSGFDETNERLDLLALDKNGLLVVIENKLDDSGRDVTWQALKYASYCSNLTKENVLEIYQDYLDKVEPGKNAEVMLTEFLDYEENDILDINKGVSQRIILVAANFRKEVTSTVLWLMSHKIKLQCFKATPFSMGNELFLKIDQIIPTKDAEDYMIGMAAKAQIDAEAMNQKYKTHQIRKEFWSKVISGMNKSNSSLYQNISTSKYHWIGASSGLRGVGFNFSITTKHARAEVYIDTGVFEDNKRIFDFFESRKTSIEDSFGAPLIWERLDNKRGSRVKAETTGNILDRSLWDDMINFMIESMIHIETAFKIHLKELI